MEMIALYCD